MLAGLFQDKVIVAILQGRKLRGFRDAAVMMPLLGESALTSSHSCRGPPTQKRCYYETRVVTAVCVNVKKRERTLVSVWNSQKMEGPLKDLRWISSMRCLASRCDRAALHASPSGQIICLRRGSLFVTASSSIIHHFWKTRESVWFYLTHKQNILESSSGCSLAKNTS